MNLQKQPATIFMWGSIFLYIVSLSVPAYCAAPGPCTEQGYLSLLVGWVEIFVLPSAGICWFANVFVLMVWFLLGKSQEFGSPKLKKKAIIFSSIAVALSAWFLNVPEILVSSSGNPTPVGVYDIGYWAWLGSMCLALIGSILIKIKIDPDLV